MRRGLINRRPGCLPGTAAWLVRDSNEPLTAMRSRTNAEGREITASLLSVSDGKAKLRMANVKALQNNVPEAKKHFRDLIGESEDWRSRTYGSHWLQRLSRMGKDKLALLNCGMQALAVLLEQDGRKEEADTVRQMRASSLRGQSLEELQSIAAGYGYLLTGLRLAPKELAQLPLPAILQLTGDVQGDSGHYWILEQVKR